MSNKECLIFQLIAILFLVAEITSKFEFTNVKCTSLDKEFGDFEHCYLKSVNRSYKYVSVKYKLLKSPVTKIKVNMAMFKRFNGYRPFMYNITVDACRFLKNRKSSPVINFWFNVIENYSNFNHYCPYNHDLLLEKLPVETVNFQVTDVLPFPEGDYLIETNWIAYDIKRAVLKFYGTIS
ncbi:uncharacterized protein LOC119551506 [Drosophila subpulchrella]|uniref:uncharacterized protein LOC119551506 n=1 Tax=Drosophila subpulchrella TaxID=1486046 RepID=UPI0018A153C5|nr:uncharacterized protein LOC119551506 [Drosophila subpulchrella]